MCGSTNKAELITGCWSLNLPMTRFFNSAAHLPICKLYGKKLANGATKKNVRRPSVDGGELMSTYFAFGGRLRTTTYYSNFEFKILECIKFQMRYSKKKCALRRRKVHSSFEIESWTDPATQSYMYNQ